MLAEARRWGYRYLVTPILESLETLALGLNHEQQRQLLKLTDQDGRVLALVGERTIPVVRVAASKLRLAPLPQRLCYAGPVLTNDPGRFTPRRESYQIGAELIGASGACADAEVIALAARCLAGAGLGGYQVDVGHAEFFQGLLDGLEVETDVKWDIRGALAARDFVRLEDILNDTPLSGAEHELLLRFPALRGGREIIDVAGALVRNRRSERALEELGGVHRLLEAYGLAQAIGIDLGAIRDFDYYTGIIFESHSQDLGRPVAQGGRYDWLMARFGRPQPATGFSINLDLVGEALRSSGAASDRNTLNAAVAWGKAGREAALQLGTSLRTLGLRVVVGTQPQALAAARPWARALSAGHLIHVANTDQMRWLAPSGRPQLVSTEALVRELCRAP
jgi:ATP phosphoribosyltransferase regulatory subunit